MPRVNIFVIAFTCFLSAVAVCSQADDHDALTTTTQSQDGKEAQSWVLKRKLAQTQSLEDKIAGSSAVNVTGGVRRRSSAYLKKACAAAYSLDPAYKAQAAVLLS